MQIRLNCPGRAAFAAPDQRSAASVRRSAASQHPGYCDAAFRDAAFRDAAFRDAAFRDAAFRDAAFRCNMQASFS